MFCSCSSASLPVAVRASNQERRRDCQKPALNGESVSGSQIRVALVAYRWLSCESVWTMVALTVFISSEPEAFHSEM